MEALTIRDTKTLWTPQGNLSPVQAKNIVCAFLDTAVSSFGRATHYNTREEQQVAETAVHNSLFAMSRDVYGVLLTLPGLTDRSIQIGLKTLLSHPKNGVTEFLNPEDERTLLYHLIQGLPPHRMLKLVDGLRVGNEKEGLKKANNARTRKLLLKTILSSSRLPLWSIKYRHRVRAALVHAWGERLTGIIRSILAKKSHNSKEKAILYTNVGRYIYKKTNKQKKDVWECISFVLGDRKNLTIPLLKSFEEAKKDLKKGKKLPKEVLEGIRSTYHPDIPSSEIMKTAAKEGTLTKGQKITMQREAKKSNIKVDMDPTDYDPIKLYLYAFEMGADEKIMKALEAKAKKAAASFPAEYENISIVVDASASMMGERTQKLRPLATTLAMRDVLEHVSENSNVIYVGGDTSGDLVQPLGDTAIADALVEALSVHPSPEAVFVISDGYENAPAGRFAEVMKEVREIGIETPVFHLNPVFAAEAVGVRELAPEEGVPTLPIQQPQAMGATFIRGLIETEPVRGINALLNMALESGPTETRKVLR